EQSGPPVRRAGLFAGRTTVTTELPRPRGVAGWGRALSRERLDTLLLEQARQAGAVVLQPWTAESLQVARDGCRYPARCVRTGAALELFGDIVVAAHGSWETGDLPTQICRRSPRAGDLFGFKVHFVQSALREDLMPLLAFPGGYGGMVHTDTGRV